jgi:hypothetical protein
LFSSVNAKAFDIFIKENFENWISNREQYWLFGTIIWNLCIRPYDICNFIETYFNTKIQKKNKLIDNIKKVNIRVNMTDKDIEKYKIQYSDYINFDNLEFKIRLSKKKDNEDEDFKTGIGITYKYKLHSPYLDVPFELFMVKYSFMSIVQNFHLPCVRCYYDGSNVYLTPSCISAHLTYMNLDYKYFAGTSNPIEIINKYRMRGFGTWLNEDEKVVLLKYSSENQNWTNLYNINIINQKTLVSNLGSLNFDHKIFKPRLYNPDTFFNSHPVNIQAGYFNISSLTSNNLETPNDYINELVERYECTHEPLNSLHKIFQNLQTINEQGSINPVEKWIIESCWNISQIKIDKTEKRKVQPLKYKNIK